MRTVKLSLLKTLKQVGVFDSFVGSRWRDEKLLILCYHGISMEDEHECESVYSMSAPLFRSRLEMLRSGGYTVLPLEEGLRRLYSHTLPRKSVAITFDDGMHNFYARAFPLLKEYGYPVTLYLTTYYCYRNLAVFPLVCRYMFWKKRGTVIAPNPSLGFETAFDLTTPAGQSQASENIRMYADARHLDADQKNELLKRLADHLGLDFRNIVEKRLFHLMNPQEVQEVSENGVDVQLHTHRHRTPLDRFLFERELIENRVGIEKLTGKKARHYCYPSGVHQPQFLPWLSGQAVSSATTCDAGLADARTNPLLLPRFLDSSNVSSVEFESWLTGVGAWVPRNPLAHCNGNH